MFEKFSNNNVMISFKILPWNEINFQSLETKHFQYLNLTPSPEDEKFPISSIRYFQPQEEEPWANLQKYIFEKNLSLKILALNYIFSVVQYLKNNLIWNNHQF